MNITLQSKADGGHIIAYIINANNVTILKVTDNQSKSCQLVPGKKYRFEWHVWGSREGKYELDAVLEPANENFPDFHWEKSYPSAHEDMGGFYFNTTEL